MDFTVFKDRLVAEGYTDDTAYAKIAHDIVLKAVRDSGFHDKLTVKGGVVMSSLTDLVRRATMDMDLDFLRYPLVNAAIRRFVSGMNRLRFGSATTRFKDIFDMYYLSRHVRRTAAKKLIKAYIFDDTKMRENGVPDILRRLGRIFGNRKFMRNLATPANAWLDVPAEEATADIVAFVSSLG